MAIRDWFRPKKRQNEANTLFGNGVLGNNILGPKAYQQILYVTTASSTTAGRGVSMDTLARNSTVSACVAVKARALAQLPIRLLCEDSSGRTYDALTYPDVSERERDKARSVMRLLTRPNNFQSAYEFWYQWLMWHELAGETFIVFWRREQQSTTQTPIEMYVLDSTLITARITPTRYPQYVLSTDSYGFNRDQPLAAHQVMHCKESGWQGMAGWNRAIFAAELVALDQDIDIYANYVMQNGAKPSGMFTTEQSIPDMKFKEIAGRLKEAWSNMLSSNTNDPSRPGQSMLLDQGMRYEAIKMLTLQDADAAALKEQTMKRLCGLFGVPSQMIGVGEGKYNNTQTMLDEFYKSTMSPLLTNIEQKLKLSLLEGFPGLHIEFQTDQFLKGSPPDQMNYCVAGVKAGIMTPNEARVYLGYAMREDGDALSSDTTPQDAIPGSSAQDTGGGGNLRVIGRTGRAGSV